MREYPFMPLEVKRLLSSETWILGDGEERAAALALWLESWHQIPAASLPDNDRMLEHLSQSKKWKKAKAHALRGWVKCSDGRLYHATVAEKALEGWIGKLLSSLSGSAGNAKRWGIEVDTNAVKAQIVDAVQRLRAIAPQSEILKKKQVREILSASPPDGKDVAPRSTGESPPDSRLDSPPDRNREGDRESKDPPIPPKGGEGPHDPEPGKIKRSAISLKAYLHANREAGVKTISETDPVFDYAEQAGIPIEFLRLHWLEFKARYSQPDAKRYKDWAAVHRKSVRGNWFRLWRIASDGTIALTTEGEQARRVHAEAA
ncbi:DUF1376 domain-containing protein [Cupriavidus necator]|uniref:DUF1376 domain-containing protein n=1 Tax=Cupriavidus necator TaxID=106590 RepID=UPI003F734834